MTWRIAGDGLNLLKTATVATSSLFFLLFSPVIAQAKELTEIFLPIDDFLVY